MKTMTKMLIVMTSLLLAIFTAHADETSCDTKHQSSQSRASSSSAITFNAVDGNGDGAITKTEFDAFNTRHFDGLDGNKDGQLTPQEMMHSHRPAQPQSHRNGTAHLNRRFAAADANRDGGLDKNEAHHMPMLTKYFSQVDTNKNGSVTRQEYYEAMPLLHGAKNIPTHDNPNEM